MIGLFPAVAIAVVLGTLVGVGQHCVGGVDGFEPLGGVGVAGVYVRVMLAGQPAVCLPDFFFVGGAGYAQGVVVIGHCSACLHRIDDAAMVRADGVAVNML